MQAAAFELELKVPEAQDEQVRAVVAVASTVTNEPGWQTVCARQTCALVPVL